MWLARTTGCRCRLRQATACACEWPLKQAENRNADLLRHEEAAEKVGRVPAAVVILGSVARGAVASPARWRGPLGLGCSLRCFLQVRMVQDSPSLCCLVEDRQRDAILMRSGWRRGDGV